MIVGAFTAEAQCRRILPRGDEDDGLGLRFSFWLIGMMTDICSPLIGNSGWVSESWRDVDLMICHLLGGLFGGVPLDPASNLLFAADSTDFAPSLTGLEVDSRPLAPVS